MKKILKDILIYCSIIFIFIILLTIQACIPNKFIEKNMQKSADQLLEKGEKTAIAFINKPIILFNFTDALMLNTIYSTESDKPLETSLVARRNFVKGSQKNIYEDTLPPGKTGKNQASYTSETFQTKELYDTVNGDDKNDCIEYARYWHGYMVILKPLLIFLDYEKIQIESKILFLILTTWLLYLIFKKIGIKEAFIFGLAFLISGVFICAISLNAIIPFYIAVIAGIYILCRNEKNKNLGFLFCIVGTFTSFFDLLTTPLVTLGIPLIIEILLNSKEKGIKKTIKLCCCWGIGYALTTILKWIITDIILDRNVVITSLQQFFYRTGTGTKKLPILTITRNVEYYGKYMFLILSIVTVIILIYRFVKNKKLDYKDTNLFIISVLPYIWLEILKNHSVIHSFFTYRILIISIICMLLIITKDLQFKGARDEK